MVFMFPEYSKAYPQELPHNIDLSPSMNSDGSGTL